MKFFKKFLPLTIVVLLAFSVVGCVYTDKSKQNLKPINYTVTINTSTEVEIVETPLIEMIENVRPTVVEVYSSLKNGTSCGSGTFFADNGEEGNEREVFVLTCHHVINDGIAYYVRDVYGNKFNAELVGGDPSSDIAVLKINTINDKNELIDVKIVNKIRNILPNKPLVKVGEEVIAIGNPLGVLGGTVTKGIISSVDREITVENRKMTLLQTDCAINRGNSGGALFSISTGEFIGVVNAGASGEIEGINFAIPSNVAIDIATKLLETYEGTNYGYVAGRGCVNVVTATDAIKENLGYYPYDMILDTYAYSQGFWGTSYYCTVVVAIESNSIYASSGIELGDVLESFSYTSDGVKSTEYTIVEAKNFIAYLKGISLKVGDTIHLKVLKNSNKETKTYDINVEQYIYHDTTKYGAVGENNA